MAQAQAEALPMERTVRLERLIDAPRELVWKAWTDPAMLARWWGPRHFTNPVCKLSLKVGGALLIVMRAPDGQEHPMTGTIREIDPPRLLRWTNEARNSDGDVLLEGGMTVTLEEEGGKTRLSIESFAVGVAPPAGFMLQGMEMGWTQSIDRLAELVEDNKGETA